MIDPGQVVAIVGVTMATVGGLSTFVVLRHDAAIKHADTLYENSIKHADKVASAAASSAAEALMQHAMRTDSRIEQGRRELDQNVAQLSARIDRIADDMVRKEDFQFMTNQLAALTGRIDRALERMGNV